MGGNHNTAIGAFNAIDRILDAVPTNIAKAVKKDAEALTPVSQVDYVMDLNLLNQVV